MTKTSIIRKRIVTIVTTCAILIGSIPFAPATVAYAASTQWDYSYETIGNSYEEWICPQTGVYTLECWGASGGGCADANGAFSGGHTSMTLNVIAGENSIFIVEKLARKTKME